MKPIPHMTKISEVSVSAMSSPPIAGKIIRDPCQRIEFNATALIICFGSISAGKIEERDGKSKPCTNPSRAEIKSTCQTRTSSVASSTASIRSRTAEVAVVKIRTERRFIRSATRPPTRVARMVGTAVAAPSRPRSSAESLSSKISHAIPTK